MDKVKIGSNCFIGYCGSGLSIFGENGKVTKITDKYIYCISDSGSIVKYNVKKQNTCGKWSKYFINFNLVRDYNDSRIVQSRPKIWNSKKCCFDYK